jgi:predicted nucleic acid-binding protein
MGEDLKPDSEEKVALVRFPFRPAVPSEAHFFSIVGAELVAEKLSVRCTPRLQLSIHDWKMFSAKSAAGRSVVFTEDFSHLSSLTPDQ